MDWPSQLSSFSGIVSKAFGKQSAHSLHSPKDEVDNGLCVGLIHSARYANRLGLGDSLVHVDLPIAGYRRNDLSTETLGIVVDQATHTIDLLDVGHISILSLGVLSKNGRFPQVIEFGFQPTWLLVGPLQMLRNIVEFWMFLLDGAALTVVLLHKAQKLVVPEWRRIRGLLQKL